MLSKIYNLPLGHSLPVFVASGVVTIRLVEANINIEIPPHLLTPVLIVIAVLAAILPHLSARTGYLIGRKYGGMLTAYISAAVAAVCAFMFYQNGTSPGGFGFAIAALLILPFSVCSTLTTKKFAPLIEKIKNDFR